MCFQVNHTLYGDNLLFEWRGMIREIMDGKFNTSLPYFNPTEERIKVIDFSTPGKNEMTLEAPSWASFCHFALSGLARGSVKRVHDSINPPVWSRRSVAKYV